MMILMIRKKKRAAELGCKRAKECLSFREFSESEEKKKETSAPVVEILPFPAATEDTIDNLPF